MGRGTLAVAVALAISFLPMRASAERIVVGDLYAEPDLRDHAAATAMLVRTTLGVASGRVADPTEVADALAKIAGRPLGAWAWIAAADAPGLLRVLGADALVLGSLSRDGARLRAAIQIIDPKGDLVAAVVASAPGDDVGALARELADAIGRSTNLSPVAAPSTSVGQLRPFGAALSALRRGQLDDLGRWLAAADPRVAGRVADARTAGRAARDRDDLPLATRLEGALLALEPERLAALASGRKVVRQPDVASALARSHLGALDTDAARRALSKARGRDAILAVAQAELGQRAGDKDARDQALAALLGADVELDPDVALAGLGVVSRLPAGALAGDLEARAFAEAAALPAAHRRLRAVLSLRAARGGIEPTRALDFIEVAELDAREVKRLAGLLTGDLASSPQGLRLRTELEVRAGKLDAARALSAKMIEAAPDDARVWALHARILESAGELRNAIAALEKAAALDARFTRELARALLTDGQVEAARKLLEGLPDDDSADLARARGLAMLDAGKTDEAVAALRRAALLDPNDLDGQAALARAFDAAGQTALAAELRDDVTELRAKGLTAREAALGDEAAGAQTAALADEQLSQLADNELRELLAAFPALAERRLRSVAVAPIAVGRAIYRPRQAVPERLDQALRLALRRHYGVQLREADVGLALDEPLVRQRLADVTADAGAASLLAYRIEADGGAAAIKLVLFDAASEEAAEVAVLIDEPRYELVEWNAGFVVGVATLVALLLFWQAFLFMRGTGAVTVKVVLDPGAQREVFNLVVSRRARRPGVDDPDEFVTRARQQGHQEGRFGATLAGPTTTFDRLPPGRWFVHLVGVYEKGNERRILGEEATKEVRIRRNKSERVELDLVPDAAEYNLTIYDGNAPASGALVWLDSNEDDKRSVPASGELTLFVPTGEHILHIDAGGLTVKKTLHVSDTRVHRVALNLERERRLADLAGGIEIGGMSSGTKGDEPAVQGRRHITAEELEEQAHSAEVATSATIGVGPGGAPGGAPAQAPAPRRGPGLSRYRRTAELGRGAMGVVYRAHDTVLERDVALKLMSDEIRRYPQALGLFLREAKALAQLNHPNIVTVFDQGEDDEGAFMVMELVEGHTVEQLLEQGDGLSLEQALDVVDQCAAGLAYAHGRRVIHRDIKPGNMFMSEDGIVKLGDFGLARVVEEMSIRKTEVRGTPLYMAPEQIKGTDVDFRADLYALGCTAFELLCGQPPFIDGQILYHHMHTPPPDLRTLAPQVPPDVAALIGRCIAKDKADRPASADELRQSLRPLRRAIG